MISGINISNNGTITISYTHDNNSVFSKALTWITNASIDSNGLFTLTFNNDKINNSTTYTQPLRWAKNIDINEYGIVTITYTNGTANPELDVLTNKIKYIDHVTLNDSQDGKLKVYYNTLDINHNQEHEDFDLVWVSTVTLTDAGVLTFKNSQGTTVLTKTLKWITDAKVEENGDFKIKFNNEVNYRTLTNIKFIKNISGSAGYINIEYNNGDDHSLIWQGTQNSTGALLAEETTPEPEPSYAEGSPWFIVDEIPLYNSNLDYIESTGTQYIDLGIPCQTGLKAKIKFSFTGHMDQGQSIFGLRNDGISSTISTSTTYGWVACLGDPGMAIGLRYPICKSNLWNGNLYWIF